MNEKQYQRERFLTKHRKEVKQSDLRKIFNRAWDSSNHLGTSLTIADMMVESYKLAKA